MQKIKTGAEMMQIFERLKHKAQSLNVPEDDNAELLQRAKRNFYLCGASKKNCDAAGLENFLIENGRQQELLNVLNDFFKRITRHELYTLCLMGDAGTGKTFSALSVLKAFCMIQKPPLMVDRVVTDADCCKQNRPPDEGCPFGKCNKSHIEKIDAGIIDFYKGLYVTSDDLCESYLSKEDSQKTFYLTTELLIVDEVGRVAQWNAKKEPSILFKVIEYRVSHDLPTIICSNCSYSEFCNVIGKALWSRINQNGQFFNLDGIPDMRSPEQQGYISTAQQHRY